MTARFCVCGHLRVDHDPDDGRGGCAMHMVGPCREFRPRPDIRAAQRRRSPETFTVAFGTLVRLVTKQDEDK